MGERVNNGEISFKGDRNGKVGTCCHCRLKYYNSARGAKYFCKYFLSLPCEKYLSQGKTDGDDVRPIMLSKSATQLNWRYVSQDVKHFMHSTSMSGGHQRRKTFKPEVMRRWPRRQVSEENQ